MTVKPCMSAVELDGVVSGGDGRCRILSQAIQLKTAHNFAFWDAVLVQTARAAGVTRLLTEDMQDGSKK